MTFTIHPVSRFFPWNDEFANWLLVLLPWLVLLLAGCASSPSFTNPTSCKAMGLKEAG